MKITMLEAMDYYAINALENNGNWSSLDIQEWKKKRGIKTK